MAPVDATAVARVNAVHAAAHLERQLARQREESRREALRAVADALAFDPDKLSVQAIVDFHRGMLESRPDAAMYRQEGRREERARLLGVFHSVAEELAENGKGLQEFALLEGRLRVLASLVMSDVALSIHTDMRSEEFDRRLRSIVDQFPDHIRDEVRAQLDALGGPDHDQDTE